MREPVAATRLALAQARATAARTRLSGTIGALQARVRPTSLVHDVTETLRERGSDMVVGLVDTAKNKPARTGAVLALVGLFFARRQVVGLIRRARADAPDAPAAAKTKPIRKGPVR